MKQRPEFRQVRPTAVAAQVLSLADAPANARFFHAGLASAMPTPPRAFSARVPNCDTLVRP